MNLLAENNLILDTIELLLTNPIMMFYGGSVILIILAMLPIWPKDK